MTSWTERLEGLQREVEMLLMTSIETDTDEMIPCQGLQTKHLLPQESLEVEQQTLQLLLQQQLFWQEMLPSMINERNFLESLEKHCKRSWR